MRRLKCLLFGALCLPLIAFGQSVTLSGLVRDGKTKNVLAYVNVTLKAKKDSGFFVGTVTGEDGRFTLSNVLSGEYMLQVSFTGYKPKSQPVLVGKLSSFLDLGVVELTPDTAVLSEVRITAAFSTRLEYTLILTTSIRRPKSDTN